MKKLFSACLLLFTSVSLFGQEEVSGEKFNAFSAVVTLQNKGISTIPNLTLGKPAVIFDMKLGRKLTFEPQFRFALETGKPWAMVFWWRYYGSAGDKFKITYHTNYSLSYKTITAYSSTGDPLELMKTTRYFVGAISPVYQLNKYLGIGAYLFYSRGLDPNMTKNTYMASFRPAFSNIPIVKDVTARIAPEVYYLKMDAKDGVFFNSRFLINKKSSSFSISGLVNNPIKSNISSEYSFLWNVGVSYTFNKKYEETN
ncbi:MAG TPA: hypothetical protein PK335_11630 [Draconibacterium sp.]|nr:hypothetical protein [Draconibacterium sp.]